MQGTCWVHTNFDATISWLRDWHHKWKKCAESKTQLSLSVNFFLESEEASKAFNMQRRAKVCHICWEDYKYCRLNSIEIRILPRSAEGNNCPHVTSTSPYKSMWTHQWSFFWSKVRSQDHRHSYALDGSSMLILDGLTSFSKDLQQPLISAWE